MQWKADPDDAANALPLLAESGADATACEMERMHWQRRSAAAAGVSAHQTGPTGVLQRGGGTRQDLGARLLLSVETISAAELDRITNAEIRGRPRHRFGTPGGGRLRNRRADASSPLDLLDPCELTASHADRAERKRQWPTRRRAFWRCNGRGAGSSRRRSALPARHGSGLILAAI